MNAITLEPRPRPDARIVNGLSVDVEAWFQVGAFEDVIDRDDCGIFGLFNPLDEWMDRIAQKP